MSNCREYEDMEEIAQEIYKINEEKPHIVEELMRRLIQKLNEKNDKEVKNLAGKFKDVLSRKVGYANLFEHDGYGKNGIKGWAEMLVILRSHLSNRPEYNEINKSPKEQYTLESKELIKLFDEIINESDLA